MSNEAPERSPPSQFIVPATVSDPLPLSAPPVKVTLLTVVGVFNVTAELTDTSAVSDGPGTWLGDQFAAVFQFPPAVFVQVIVAARVWQKNVPRKISIAARAKGAPKAGSSRQLFLVKSVEIVERIFIISGPTNAGSAAQSSRLNRARLSGMLDSATLDPELRSRPF
jgi:hypothetical protein